MTIATGELTGLQQVYGAVFDCDHLYISGFSARDDAKLLFILDRNSEVIDTLVQPGWSPFGMGDLAWNGEYIWGSGWGYFYGMNSIGEVQDSIRNPEFYYNRAIASDDNNELFYVADATSDIIPITRDGEIGDAIENPGLRIYGMAWRDNDPDNCNLYLFCREGPGDTQVNKLNVENGDVRYVFDIPSEPGERAGGCAITYEWDTRHWTFIAQFVGDGNRTTIFNLDETDSWVSLQPNSGSIDPGRYLPISMQFDSRALNIGQVLEGYFIIDGRQRGGQDTLRVVMNIDEQRVQQEDDAVHMPEILQLTSYPNPFNSKIRIIFNLPLKGTHRLALYDLEGRLVETLSNGVNTGISNIVEFDAGDLGSGIYFVVLKSGAQKLARRLILLK